MQLLGICSAPMTTSLRVDEYEQPPPAVGKVLLQTCAELEGNKRDGGKLIAAAATATAARHRAL